MPVGNTVTDPSHTAEGAAQDSICFAELKGGVVVIRISGRGSFANSVEMKNLTDHFAAKHAAGGCQFVVDLEHCATMDSTFMGVLASIGLRQKRDTGTLMTLVNVTEQNTRLLQTLGLAHFIHVRPIGAAQPDTSGATFQQVEKAQVTRVDQIVHMMEAHENLCEADSENSVRFEGVLKYLTESLEREKEK